MGKLNQDKVDHIVQTILRDYEDGKYINNTDLYNQPDKKAIIEIVEKLLKVLYPGYYSDKVYKIYSLRNNMSAAIEDVIFHLNKQIMIVLRYCFPFTEMSVSELEEKAENMTFDFMEKIPRIREYLETDIQEAYDGDPAAESKAEIILSMRLMFPYALIPSTTSLGTIHPQGRELGLKAGANVIMPNLTPVGVRKLYSLYENKICTGEETAQCRGCLEHRVKSAGYKIVTSIGNRIKVIEL